MSLFKSDSEISRFNNFESLDWFPVSFETLDVVRVSLSASMISGGAFDITSSPFVDVWGFGVDRERRSIDEIINEVERVKPFVGYDKLAVRVEPPSIKKTVLGLRVDLSAVAKGYAVDVISRFCVESGFANYMIEIGGEVCCRGNKVGGESWKVGIESPDIIPRGDWGGIYQVIIIGNQCMATSGGNRNLRKIDGKYYSHLIDPRTGLSCQSGDENKLEAEEQLGSVSVLDENCVRADALATAFFVLGVSAGVKIANENDIPVLFLVRKDKEIKEIASDTFYKSAKKITTKK
jgi:thiamine biosynthesis lipoprotein